MRFVRFEWCVLAVLTVYGCDAAKAEGSGDPPPIQESPKPMEAAEKSDPCDGVESPQAMVCIPEGSAVIGSDEHLASEKPRHDVEISTFFIDKFEVTNGQYAACEKAGHCPKRRGMPRSYKTFLEDDLPAIPIAWRMAHKYCVWAGKRLPTEAEWEKVARNGDEGRLYPWGGEAPTCDKANYKECKPM